MQRSSALLVALAVLGALLLLSIPAGAAVPRLLNYQGTLTDTLGVPLSGPRDMTFRLYSDSAGAAPALWEEEHLAVPVEAGLFQLMLGSLVAIPDSLIPMDTLWLGVTVGTDSEMEPRQRIGSVLWALRAGVADSALVAPLASHDHDDRYYTETELAAPGTINEPANPVDWTKLKNVPAGFADGTDDVGGGGGDWTIDGDNIYSAVPGKVGIGTATPLAKLTIEDDGSVFAAGSLYVGDTLGVNAPGSYLMWYPYKGAFRAGYVYSANTWNDASIGRYTAAFGRNTKATQEGGFAWGWSSEATGGYATAGGFNATASGLYSLAFGHYASALGKNALALGKNVTAAADSSMVIGVGKSGAQRLINNTKRSLMIGFSTDKPTLFVGGDDKRVGVNTAAPEFPLSVGSNVSGDDGSFLARGRLNEGIDLQTGIGGVMMMWYPRKAALRAGELETSDLQTQNIGTYSTGLGHYVRASGSGSAAIGEYVVASGANAMTLGSGISLGNRLTNATNNSLLVAFADTAATLFVGGPSDRVGVKTRAPQADFDVAGKAQVDSFQMPTGAANGYVLTSNAAGKGSWQPAGTGGDTDWTIAGNDMYSNVSGNVGIGTSSPAQKLDVAGTARLAANVAPNLVIHDANGSNDRPGIQFTNNSQHYIYGDDASDEYFIVSTNPTDTRANDAHLRVAGSASGSWGNYVEITHDGVDGRVKTDAGDLVLEPTGNVGIGTATPAAKLDVAGRSVNVQRLYTIGGEEALSLNGASNLFVGVEVPDTVSAVFACSSNVFVGSGAGWPYTEGPRIGNVLIGRLAGTFNDPGVAMRKNVIIGDWAGYYHTGDENVLIGAGTGWYLDGSRNTVVGTAAGPGGGGTRNGAVSIGYDAPAQSGRLNIATDSTDVLIHGDFSTGQVEIGGASSLMGRLTIPPSASFPAFVLAASPNWYFDAGVGSKLKIGTGYAVGSGVKFSIASSGAIHAGGNVSGSDSSYVDLNKNLRGIYSFSTDSVAVYAKSSNWIAVDAVSSANYGVRATSTSQEGVVAYSTNDRAIYGQSTNSYAGYFDGNVYVAGLINKAACSFLIDHPLDPENKTLRHNCVESPENLLIYRGRVKLDPKGEAAVTLPDYFEALTKEDQASIHLTPVGRPFPAGADWNSGFRSFTVYGDANREVFWEVLADRDDPVIRQIGAPVEEAKTTDSKTCTPGRLLYPTAYGYPESKGMGYEEREALREGR